ncbi:restriction endonuclease subunit S [Marinilactibacillus sp. GCM10026970]|uniref:restriction endonuclease subunit S n=1 Tax=Marinilactibacillus sp. GCM10026970 TaxID=3252642 RepID=UPI003613E791
MSRSEGEKYPEMRFNGFTEAWEQRKFTEIVDRVKTSSNSDLLPKVEFEDIKAGEGRLNKDVSHKFDTRKGTHFKPNNILFGKLRPYLKNWLLPDFEGIALGDFWVFEPKNSDANFIYYLIQASKYQKVANDTSGTKMPRSDWKQVSTTSFSVPCFEEQIKIGSFLKRLDNTIALHQRKLDRLQRLKKAYLQVMFPKQEYKIPEVRFANFNDPWEQRKLEELATFKKGSGYSKSDLRSEGTPAIHYGRLYTDYEILIKDVDTFVEVKENSIISQGNEVIVPASGETSEDISRASVVVKAGIILGGDLNVIKPNVLVDSSFLALTISNGEQQKELTRRAQGKSVVHLRNSDLKEVNLSYPIIDEQRKIGSFFERFDNIIGLNQKEIDKLNLLKKAYLKKMFI